MTKKLFFIYLFYCIFVVRVDLGPTYACPPMYPHPKLQTKPYGHVMCAAAEVIIINKNIDLGALLQLQFGPVWLV